MDAKVARILEGLTMTEAARKIGVSRNTILLWEQGETAPTLQKARKAAKVYRVKLDDLEFKGEK